MYIPFYQNVYGDGVMSKRKFLSMLFGITSLFSSINFSHAIANPASIATEQDFVSQAGGDAEKLVYNMTWWFDSNELGAKSRSKQEAIEFAKKYGCDENKILEIWSRHHTEGDQNTINDDDKADEYLNLVKENGNLKKELQERKDFQKYIMDKISECDGTVWEPVDYRTSSTNLLKEKLSSIFATFKALSTNPKPRQDDNLNKKNESTKNMNSVTAEKIGNYNNIFNF